MPVNPHNSSNPQHPTKVVLSFGSNCGDRKDNVRKALDWLCKNFSESKVSEIYETPEIHGVGNPYINAVGSCRVDCTLDEMIAHTKEYEFENGRDSACRQRGDVPIDIDVVIWNEEIIRPLDYSSSFFKIGYAMITED